MAIQPTSSGTLTPQYSSDLSSYNTGSPFSTSSPQQPITQPQNASYGSADLSGGFNGSTQTTKPTPVVSSKPAQSQAQTIQDTASQGQEQLDTLANTPSPYNDVRDENGLLMNPPGALYDRNTGQPIPSTSTKTATTATSSTDPMLDAVLNDPGEGNTFYYNLTNGQKTALPTTPTGQAPTGYSKLDPMTRTDVVSTVNAPGGIVYKQFSDGTYGRYNLTTGTYTQANSSDFIQAQALQTATDNLNNLSKGILTSAQQSQIDAIKSQFQTIIDQQTTANNNAIGGVTVAQNLYGMGANAVGKGAITQVVNDGAKKIADLQAKMASAIASMQQGFQSDDMNAVKTAYDQYTSSQRTVQDQLDAIRDQLNAQQNKEDASFQAFADAIDKKYPGVVTGLETNRQQITTELQNDPRYLRDQEKLNTALQLSQDKLQAQSLTLTPDQVQIWADQAAQDPTLLTKFGYGSNPNKEAVLSAIAEGIKNGKYPNLANNKVDLKYATNTTVQDRLKYLSSLVGTNGQGGNLEELVNISNSINRSQFPPVNSVEFAALEKSGDPDVAKYAAVVTEVADQVAKILQGGGSGSGTSDAKLKQANDLFNKSFNKDQVVAVAHELQKLLSNRKNAMIGTNPFLQQYSDTAPTPSSATANIGGASTFGSANTSSVDQGWDW